MRKRREDQRSFGDRRLLGVDQCDLPAGDRHALTAPLSRGGETELETGVSTDERAELPAGIPAGPEYSDWEFMHKECISGLGAAVNAEVLACLIAFAHLE